MKTAGIIILVLLLSLFTFSTAKNSFGQMEKPFKVLIVDCEEKSPVDDIEDKKMYTSLLYAPFSFFSDRIENNENIYFQYAAFSLFKPPKTLFA